VEDASLRIGGFYQLTVSGLGNTVEFPCFVTLDAGGQPAGKPHISGIRQQALHLPEPFDFVCERMYPFY
jgi:hypothetical protein